LRSCASREDIAASPGGFRSGSRARLALNRHLAPLTHDLAAFASGALRSRQPIDGGQRLTFTGGAEVERELRAAVAAEAACCAFLDMTLVRTSEGLVLEVTGPAQARPLIAELFA
jgi:hypothetical protein